MVYAVDDPHDPAAGGAATLRAAGVDVRSGLSARAAFELNRRWFEAVLAKRPFVTLHIAQTLDSRIAAADGTSQWISSPESLADNHGLRSRVDAILVGTQTLLVDNPRLTARDASGEAAGSQPLRAVMGLRGIPDDAAIHGDDGRVLHLPTRDPHEALAQLFSAGVRHVMVEGGSRILSAFLAAGLVDELIVYLAPTLLGSGTRSPRRPRHHHPVGGPGLGMGCGVRGSRADPRPGPEAAPLPGAPRNPPAWQSKPRPRTFPIRNPPTRTLTAPHRRGHRHRRPLMFTGIIAEQGKVLSVERNGDVSATVRLHAPGSTEGLALGGSVAVNGVCLTATAIDGKDFSVDVMGETLVRSTIGELDAGDTVNLERCVPAGGRLDGHVVQGHVDGVGELLEREGLGNWDRLRFGVPVRLARYIAEKGSIAVDGVSLTVTAVSDGPGTGPVVRSGPHPHHPRRNRAGREEHRRQGQPGS